MREPAQNFSTGSVEPRQSFASASSTIFVILIVSFFLNLVWEYLQLPLYTDYGQLGHGLPLVLWASAGDVMYTAIALLALKFFEPRRYEYGWLALEGFLLALFVEYKALVLHRWAYTAAMPTLWGVGISPLVQLAVLIPLSVYISKLLTR